MSSIWQQVLPHLAGVTTVQLAPLHASCHERAQRRHFRSHHSEVPGALRPRLALRRRRRLVLRRHHDRLLKTTAPRAILATWRLLRDSNHSSCASKHRHPVAPEGPRRKGRNHDDAATSDVTLRRRYAVLPARPSAAQSSPCAAQLLRGRRGGERAARAAAGARAAKRGGLRRLARAAGRRQRTRRSGPLPCCAPGVGESAQADTADCGAPRKHGELAQRRALRVHRCCACIAAARAESAFAHTPGSSIPGNRGVLARCCRCRTCVERLRCVSLALAWTDAPYSLRRRDHAERELG